jgi:hypothetical protein
MTESNLTKKMTRRQKNRHHDTGLAGNAPGNHHPKGPEHNHVENAEDGNKNHSEHRRTDMNEISKSIATIILAVASIVAVIAAGNFLNEYGSADPRAEVTKPSSPEFWQVPAPDAAIPDNDPNWNERVAYNKPEGARPQSPAYWSRPAASIRAPGFSLSTPDAWRPPTASVRPPSYSLSIPDAWSRPTASVRPPNYSLSIPDAWSRPTASARPPSFSLNSPNGWKEPARYIGVPA